jgi:hypothetical protein
MEKYREADIKAVVRMGIIVGALFYTFSFLFVPNSFAQTQTLQSNNPAVNVAGTVGEFQLNLYGWVSPYANVILSSSGVYMGATVADKKGDWSFVDIYIKRGFSGFCLTAIDFYRLGESETCLKIPPAQEGVTMRDIFLPPTLGLSRNEVPAGGKVLAFGYTMPNAKVTLHLSNGQLLQTIADSKGYYQFELDKIPAGKYQLFATAHYQSKDSLKPSKTVELIALSWWEQFIAWLAWLWKVIRTFFTSIGLGPLWVGLPLLGLIIWLILKLWPEKFTFIYESKLLAFLPLPHKEKRLHHWWMEGVGF